MRYIGYTRKFLEDLNVNLTGMVPSDYLVTNGWCYARPGDEYIVYLISGGTTTVCGFAGLLYSDLVQSAERGPALCKRRTNFLGAGRQRLGASHQGRRRSPALRRRPARHSRPSQALAAVPGTFVVTATPASSVPAAR